jgi:hypothetical protein
MSKRSSLACLLAALFAIASLCTAAQPAAAEIKKFLTNCKGGLCPHFRTTVEIPEGWVEDKEASAYFDAVMLLPKGIDFDTAPAKIYAVVRYNPKKQPVADFLPDAIRQWKSLARNVTITALPELKRANGKGVFVRHQFEAPRLKEQGFELQAATAEDDADGNNFIVTITLSANTRAAFDAAQPAYRSILERF